MKNYRGLVRRIVDELMANSIDAKATEIKVNVNEDAGGITVRVEDNGAGMTEDIRDGVSKTLNRARRDEYDKYYGNLAGESMVGRGLSIVGYMVDYAKVESQKGQGTMIEVFRKKD